MEARTLIFGTYRFCTASKVYLITQEQIVD
jgi:hypothetical protein